MNLTIEKEEAVQNVKKVAADLPDLGKLRGKVAAATVALTNAERARVTHRRKSLFGLSSTDDATCLKDIDRARAKLEQAKVALEDGEFAHKVVAEALPEAEAQAKIVVGHRLVEQARTLTESINAKVTELDGLLHEADVLASAIERQYADTTLHGFRVVRGLSDRGVLGKLTFWRKALSNERLTVWRELLSPTLVVVRPEAPELTQEQRLELQDQGRQRRG
jgi:hypothetical protein